MKVHFRKGDSLSYYSRLFLIPLNLILDSNPNINVSNLQTGQEINIPGFFIQPYTLQEEDILWKIAAKRNLSIDALLLLNQHIHPNQLQVGQSLQLPVRVIDRVVDEKSNYHFQTLVRDIHKLKEMYPFIKVETIGESVLGKPIYEIRFGNGSKKVHFNASFHANEWITSAVLMCLVETFLLSLTNSGILRGLATLPLYNEVDLSIVPMVNPDGVDLVVTGPPVSLKNEVVQLNGGSTDFSNWKANIRGVDLNKQFPAKWELEKGRLSSKAPAPRDYPGVTPLSEPEAIAMVDLAKNRLFNRLLAFHTQGEEFYWGYEGLEPDESKNMSIEFERMSGYKSVQYIDSFAGYKDWFIQEFHKPGFTIELGKGKNPLPLSQFNNIYEETLGIFLASLYV
ncbi:M14 family metallopeptidase [Bacillus sp. 03113]|uniref:M14 family metallopeptidase n=1 Tax=Bacillus sp. 03113 TaxID=2578211 RepID=UPI001141F7FF|nr:M14 family zinc carboxypeptidase [Bacillus sp. 03113]